MALLWADNFDNYGFDETYMLDGIYAEVRDMTLQPDPDTLETGNALYMTFGSFDSPTLRFALPTALDTVGFSCRVYLVGLPTTSNQLPVVVGLRNTSNANQCGIRIETDGRISAVRGHTGNGTVLGTTAAPAVTAHAWHHVETKIFLSATVGTVEVRVNGVTVLNLTGQNTLGATGSCTQTITGCPTFDQVSGWPTYFKDLIWWDTTGSSNNDFLGSCHVYSLIPDGDTSLNWSASFGATGNNLIDGTIPSNVLTATGRLDVDGSENIQIDGVYYRPTAGSVDAGTPAGTSSNPWLVAQGTDTETDLVNLHAAINGSGTPGTTYSTALTAHSTVDAVGLNATQILLQPVDQTTSTYSCTETMANASFASSTMNVYGPQDLSYISADNPAPAAAVFTVSNLPADIVSVKALLPVVRAKKIDGGDGNVQMGLTGTLTDLGANRPITTAFTYWWDVSELSPDTGAAWTPVETDAVKLQIDRTT